MDKERRVEEFAGLGEATGGRSFDPLPPGAAPVWDSAHGTTARTPP